MLAVLYGLMVVDFTNSNGERVIGRNGFFGFEDSNVEGVRTEKFFIGNDVPFPECNIGDELELTFNYRGKLESVTKA